MKNMKKKLVVSTATFLLVSQILTPVIGFAEALTANETEPSVEVPEESTETTDSSSTESSSTETTDSSSGETTEETTTSTETIPQTSDSSASSGSVQQPATVNKVPDVSPEEGEPVLEHTTVSNLDEIVIVKNQTTDEFIKSIGEQARKVAHEKDLYASVMIAQAILESASGNSGLSVAPYHNLFGIKGDFKGASVVMKTQEDDGSGNLYTIDSAFRHYPSYKESLEDYAKLLKEGLSGNVEFYKGTWKSETQSYTDATAFLTGKYATDVQYAEKINKLIEVYELTGYDKWTPEKTPEQIQKEKKLAEEKKVKEQQEKVRKIKITRADLRKQVAQIEQKKRDEELKLLVKEPKQYIFNWIKQANV